MLTSAQKDPKALEKLAYELRIDIIEMLTRAGSGHTAGSLGVTDIIATIYFDFLKRHKGIFILSNGHVCPALYAVLARIGAIPQTALKNLRKTGALLQGHPDRRIPGIVTATGSLGQGFSVAVGYALAKQMDNANTKIYCLSSDGELDEGQIWEAVMTASKYKLNNLLWIIDRNNIQIDGFTWDIMPLNNLREKLESFGWYVLEINGHNITEIQSAISMAERIKNRPTAIIAHTVPGKGVAFMENRPDWHGKAPSETERRQAVKELKAKLRKIN